MSTTLSEKIAFVTGGSRGIGAAIVRRLARDGATVAFTYSASPEPAHELVAEIESAGGQAMAIQSDSAQPEQIQSAVRQVAERFGRIDILVNNAGVLISGMVDDYKLADFDKMFAINVRAVFVGIQAVLPHMSSGGRIITTGSIVAERVAFPASSVYAMTKGAIASMTKGLARDLASRGITVNAIAPGPTDTGIVTDPDQLGFIQSLMPIGRLGTPDEVASLAAYLASPESSFITGSSLTIDGGYLS